MSTIRLAALTLAMLAAATVAYAQAPATDTPAPPPSETSAPESPQAPAEVAPPAPQAPETAPAPAGAAPAPDAATTDKAEPPVADETGPVIGEPPEGKGQIVFFRPSRMIGMAIAWKLSDDKTPIGKVANAHYVVIPMDPGAHTLVLDFGTKGSLHMEIDPGETYYVECGIAMGALLNHPDLIPSDRDAFNVIARKLKPTKPKA